MQLKTDWPSLSFRAECSQLLALFDSAWRSSQVQSSCLVSPGPEVGLRRTTWSQVTVLAVELHWFDTTNKVTACRWKPPSLHLNFRFPEFLLCSALGCWVFLGALRSSPGGKVVLWRLKSLGMSCTSWLSSSLSAPSHKIPINLHHWLTPLSLFLCQVGGM